MACRLSYERTATSTILILLVLLEAALVSDQVSAAPVQQQRSDILAGTEFLSVFINGAMAPLPVAPASPRRRGFRRGGGSHSGSDNLPAESRQSEASIYRISRAPSSPRPLVTRSGYREDGAKLYPISQKTTESRDHQTTSHTELSPAGESKQSQQPHQQPQRVHHQHHPHRSNGSETSSVVILKNRPNHRNVNQKVIGVSVTSTVEATPYKVRVEHHDAESKPSAVTRPPLADFIVTEAFAASTGTTPRSTGVATATTTTGTRRTTGTTATTVPSSSTASTTTVTPLPAQLVTEELSNIVSESNRSEFSVDEGLPKTSWRGRSPVTTGSIVPRSSTPSPTSSSPTATSMSALPVDRLKNPLKDSQETSTSLEPIEESYELPEENSEPREHHKEPSEAPERVHQGRKAGRHYDATLYNQPPKVYPHETSKIYRKPARAYGETKNGYSQPESNYGEPARVYGEPAKVYSEPAKVYSEPSKIYGEPAKVYGEPERVYGEPAKVYSEPAKVYSEPSKVYGEPAKVYSEPSKMYGSDGRPLAQKARQGEPEEQNYEVDEAVSVGSNGNAHGPQTVTEATPRAPQSSSSSSSRDNPDGHKVGYVVDERNYRKYRVEERTPDGFIVGEYGVVSHDDGSLRGVRYTADGTIDPRLIYDALMKFLAL